MINWKVRFKNKTWLLAFIGTIIAFIYQILGILGIVAPVSEESVTRILGIALNLLVAIGVIQDPTTSGLSDSTQALEYEEPKTE